MSLRPIDWRDVDVTDVLAKAQWDVELFAWKLLGIKLHPGQKLMAKAYLMRNKGSVWRALYLWLCIAAGNRAGKTLGLAIIILHSCVYRMGMEPPDDDSDEAYRRWANVPYHWWHFAVEQGPAEQVFSEIILLLSGNHPAQKFGCPWSLKSGEGDPIAGARRIASATQTEGVEWTNGSKERGEYAQIILAKEYGNAIIHFRSTKAKALSAIGQNMHGLSFDEAGLETALDYLLNEIMHARRLGTGGQFILIGTASVATSTDFQDLWYKGDPEDPFAEQRRFSVRMSTRENIGFGIDRETFDAMIEGMSDDWIAQNIDGQFIQSVLAWFHQPSVDACFHEDLHEEEPKLLRVYLHSLDPGLKDKCWSLVFRITKDRKAIGVSIERQFGKQTTRGIIALGVRQHRRYGSWNPNFKKNGRPEYGAQIDTGVDTTALGGHMFRDLITEEIEITSVEFGGNLKVKRQMLSDLKTAIDEGRFEMPADGWWKEVRTQLRNYKLLDRKQEQDLVMGLAIIAKLLRTVSVLQTDELIAASKFELGIVEVQPKVPPDGINKRSVRYEQAHGVSERDRIIASVRLTEEEKALLLARLDSLTETSGG
jgi:hypothetical protein